MIPGRTRTRHQVLPTRRLIVILILGNSARCHRATAVLMRHGADGCVSKGPGGGLAIDRGTDSGPTELRRDQAVLVRLDLGPGDLWRPGYSSKVHRSVRRPTERPAPLRFRALHSPTCHG
jgi:hypothetical protein